MPYNADKFEQYRQHQHQHQCPHYPGVPNTGNHYDAAQYSNQYGQMAIPQPEVIVPQQNYYQHTVNQAHYVNQQAAGQFQPAPIREHRLPQNVGQPVPTHVAQNGKDFAARTLSVQVVVPSKAISSPPPPAVDHQEVLLALADEYLAAAYDRNMQEALVQGEARLDDYYKLLSTALGCMEAVLTRYRLPPVKEALLRLRFARTLMAETQNYLEAETALSKGIDLCERNKFLDLKYTMQVSLCRVLYRSSPKAATKAIDGIIEDVTTYKHTAWEYAFRLLRASLSLSTHSHQDFIAAVHQLQKTADLAHRRGDHAVFLFASVMEALAHLQSSSPESAEHAQRALATARRVQLSQDMNAVPQIQILVHYIDLCCSLRQFNLEQVGQKLSTMQEIMDKIVDDVNWRDEGSIYLPICSKSTQGTPPMGGDVIQDNDGKLFLTMTWLSKSEVYSIGYLLSAVASNSKGAQNDSQAEKFLDKGIALIRGDGQTSRSFAEPLEASSDRLIRYKVLECQFIVEKVFLLCAHSEWEKARANLDRILESCRESQIQLPPELGCLVQYANAVIYQGTGDLTQALDILLGKDLALPQNCSKNSNNNIRRDVALLAAMNAMLIIRSPGHPSHHLLASIYSKCDPYLSASINKHILASRSLMISVLDPSTHHLVTTESLSSTLLIKKHLSNALNISRTIGNTQITAITLSVMSAKFFKGVVGEQAEKSARAGQNMSNKSGIKLWISVSNGMLADTLERQGKMHEVEKAQQAAIRLAAQMPRAVQRYESEIQSSNQELLNTKNHREGKSKHSYHNDTDDMDELA